MEFNLSLEYDRETASLSMYDLMSVKEFKDAVINNDEELIDSLLYGVGVDLTEGYVVVNRLHRPLMSKDNTPVEGSIIIYKERRDKEWIKSGAASMEATINSSEDMFLREDLWRMQDAFLSLDKIKAKADGC